MYTYSSRVRYSEVDENGKLTLCSLLNYFQDGSTFHSEDIGLGYKVLLERGIVWVLSAWQIVVTRYPELCESIIIGTSPYGFGSVIGYRNFLMTTDKGEQLACANSIWTLIDTVKGRPTRPSPDILNTYKLEEKLPMDYADRKITLPEEGRPLSPIQVKPHHIDTNKHVNNGQYINIAMNILTEQNKAKEIKMLRAEYKAPAVLGDIIHPRQITSADKEIIVLQSKEGSTFCITEFTHA